MSTTTLSGSTLGLIPGCLSLRHPTLVQTHPETPSSQGLPCELGRSQMLALMDRFSAPWLCPGPAAASALKELAEVFPGEAGLTEEWERADRRGEDFSFPVRGIPELK